MLWKLTLKCHHGRVVDPPTVIDAVEIEARDGKLVCYNRSVGGSRSRVLWMESARPTAWEPNSNRIALVGVEVSDGERYLQEVHLESLPSSEEHAHGRSNS